MHEQDSTQHCTKLLGIASVAQIYESSRLANFTVKAALAMLEKNTSWHLDAALARRILSTSSLWSDQPDIVQRGRTLLIGAIKSSRVDKVRFIQDVADPQNDHELLGWCYYHILLEGEESWRREKRLRTIDRRRLLCGAVALAEKCRWIYQQIGYAPPASSSQLPWAIFTNVPSSVYSAPYLQKVTQNLFSYFDPEPWGI